MKNLIIGLITLLFFINGNSQEIQTYKGDYIISSERLNMFNQYATYTYYENEDMTRTYHGPFLLTFYGNEKRKGEISGQFNNGFYEGEWTIQYPFIKNDQKYIAIMRCNFKNGELVGQLEVIVKNIANNIVANSVMHFENGKLNGEINFKNNIPHLFINELKGEFANGQRIGKWSYRSGTEKGLAIYDEDGYEKENYLIDNATGAKKYGESLHLYNLEYGNFSVRDFLGALYQISNDESKRFNYLLN